MKLLYLPITMALMALPIGAMEDKRKQKKSVYFTWNISTSFFSFMRFKKQEPLLPKNSLNSQEYKNITPINFTPLIPNQISVPYLKLEATTTTRPSISSLAQVDPSFAKWTEILTPKKKRQKITDQGETKIESESAEKKDLPEKYRKLRITITERRSCTPIIITSVHNTEHDDS